MSWKGALIKSGIDSDGINVDIFRGNLTVYGTVTAGGGITMDSIDIGTAAVPYALGTSLTLRAVEVYTSSASVNAGTSIRPIYMLHTVLAAGGVGHRAEFHTRCNVAAGPWINALKGYMEFDNAAGTGIAGRTTGLASAICAELLMPDAAVPTGSYFPLEIEFVGQTNSGPGVTHGFMTARASGVLTNFNASGFLLDVQGMTAATGAMVSLTSQTLKCYIGAATRYMVLGQLEDGLGLGVTGTPMDLPLYTDRAVAIFTTSDVTNEGVITSFQLHQRSTGYTGEHRTMDVTGYADVYSGNECTVGHFYAQWGTTSGIGPIGLSSAVTAKMLLPTMMTGAFHAIYAKMNMPTNPNIMHPGGNAAGWFMLSIGGEAAGKQQFDDYGVFMDIHNLTAEAGHLLSLHSQTLKSVIDVTTFRYLMLSQMEDGLGLGLTGSHMVLSSAATKAIQIYTTTSVATAIQVSAIELNYARTADNSLNARDWGIKVNMTSTHKYPTVTGIYCSLTLVAAGCHGRGNALQGELIMPNAQIIRGTWSSLHLEISQGANTNTGSSGPLSFISCIGAGTLTDMDARGYLFEITGFTPGNDKFIDNAGTGMTGDFAIRCLVNGVVKYLLFADDAENP